LGGADLLLHVLTRRGGTTPTQEGAIVKTESRPQSFFAMSLGPASAEHASQASASSRHEPRLGDRAHLLDGVEEIGVGDLFAEGPIEPLDEGVLIALPGLDDLLHDSRFEELIRLELQQVESGRLKPTAMFGVLTKGSNRGE
jgi:hypothetical protein